MKVNIYLFFSVVEALLVHFYFNNFKLDSVDEDLDRFNAIEHLEETSEAEKNNQFEKKVNAIR